MSAPQPPREIVAYWCPACGRQWSNGRAPSRQPHLDGGGYCPGDWQRLVYTLIEPAPKEV